MSTQESGLMHAELRRREALLVVGGLGVGAMWKLSGAGSAAAQFSSGRASIARACVLTPELTEGPYWIANHPTRRNITEGLPGLALQLHLVVVHGGTCAPIKAADVELWHASATGVYSGFASTSGPPGSSNGPTDASRFLRGHQVSDAHGRVTFDTIYPGWYQGRTPHVHIKAHVGGHVVHTGQLFFADPTSDAVYRTGAYASHGQPDTPNSADGIYAQGGGARAQVRLTKRTAKSGYVGTMTLVVT